jgi:SAM-dependent methyltransferase
LAKNKEVIDERYSLACRIIDQNFHDNWTTRFDDQRTKDEMNFIVQQLDLPSIAKVLDLCCGYKRHSLDLAHRSFQLTGQDLSPVSLQREAFPTMDQFHGVSHFFQNYRELIVENQP